MILFYVIIFWWIENSDEQYLFEMEGFLDKSTNFCKFLLNINKQNY